MKVLLLSVAAGGGHMKTAENLKTYINNNFPDCEVQLIDTLKYINPVIDRIVIGSYLNSLKSTPQIYGKIYELAETAENITDFSKTLNRMISYKIKQLLYEFNPDVIVCTHPFPLQMISNLKKRGKIKATVIATLTDFISHPFWIQSGTDAFIVAHEYMRDELILKGIDKDCIYPLGIPVGEDFLKIYDKEAEFKRIGLENKPTILLMGGSLGFGDIKDVFLSLVDSKLDINIIVVTGKNPKLKRKLEKLIGTSHKNIYILGYTHKVSKYMSISDVLITKPGGLTISEAMIKELPMILISPIPGQEEKNARFLQNMGVALRLYENDNLDILLKQILCNTAHKDCIKELEKNLARPDALKDVSELIINFCNNESENEC